MSRSNPVNLARSVRQRLLNISRLQREDFQLTLIRYALERFLYRLSCSRHRHRFVLKGAMLFQIWSDQTRRPTRDVDFLSVGEPTEAGFLPLFEEICRLDVEEDGLVFEPRSLRLESMKEEEKYQGLRIRLNAMLESARIPVQIDLGFGDAVTPSPVEIDYPTLLDFQAPRLSAYPRETVVAEKYQAMVLLGMANSRMKDFYDLWVLSNQFSFTGGLLQRAIAATFQRRQTPLPIQPPLALTDEFGTDDRKRTQWNAFLKKAKLDSGGASLEQVCQRLAVFLMPPTLAAASDEEFEQAWIPGAEGQAGWTVVGGEPVAGGLADQGGKL